MIAKFLWSSQVWPKNPQVRKKGVDAVHEKLPTEGLYHEKNVICNVCIIKTIDGGQKDVLLKKANI